MATKLGRKEFPTGYTPDEFKYQGRPAKNQDDFGPDVGLADCVCVNQFGEANNSKYYHGGVVKAKDGTYWVYLQWGRIKSGGKSWEGGTFREQDYQFVRCNDEDDARAFFQKQLRSKNVKRLIQQTIGGVEVWTGKKGNDGYLVQSLATRERGLPDAYSIKDDSGVSAKDKKNGNGSKAPKRTKSKGPKLGRSYHPAEIALATSLLGGTQSYTRALSKSAGVTPTMDAIRQVRDDLIPAALARCAAVGSDVQRQLRDDKLIAISKAIFALVPRYIPREGLAEEDAIMNATNVLQVQQDLDAFEAALKNEDWSMVEDSSTPGIDPDAALNATLRWIDPKSELGAFVGNTFNRLNPRRHANVRNLRIRNMFSVERPDRDALFVQKVENLAKSRKGQHLGDVTPQYQPPKRIDLADVGDFATGANVFVGVHGTRSVNVSPILQGNFRLPRYLKGVHITGAAFGGGLYYATQVGKAAQYVGAGASVYGSGGRIKGRGYFMFLCDVAGGKFHYPRQAWSIGNTVPGGGDSVYASPQKIRTLVNDEHVIFDAAQQRIRYLIEIDL